MKKIIISAIIFMLPVVGTLVNAQEPNNDFKTILDKLEELKPAEGKCAVPESALGGVDCFMCHVAGADFPDLKETVFDEGYAYPNKSTKIIEKDGEKIGHFYLTEIPEQELYDAFNYFERHDINKVIIEIQCPGGSVFDAIRDINIIQTFQKKGMKIDTHLYGFAASAGFLVFMAGDERLACENATLMWHEIQSYKIFFGAGIDVTTPSDSEEEARILRFLNDIGQNFIASKCNLLKEDLDKLVKKKELWILGADALTEYGFATGIL